MLGTSPGVTVRDDLTLAPSISSGECYKIYPDPTDPGEDEYFLLEYRRAAESNSYYEANHSTLYCSDNYMPGSGLLITHYDVGIREWPVAAAAWPPTAIQSPAVCAEDARETARPRPPEEGGMPGLAKTRVDQHRASTTKLCAKTWLPTLLQ